MKNLGLLEPVSVHVEYSSCQVFQVVSVDFEVIPCNLEFLCQDFKRPQFLSILTKIYGKYGDQGCVGYH